MLPADSLWQRLPAGGSSSSRRRGQGHDVAPLGICRGFAEIWSWARAAGPPQCLRGQGRAGCVGCFIEKLLHGRNRKCRRKCQKKAPK